MLDEKQLSRLGPFTRGINLVAGETSLGSGELRNALNVSIDNDGGVARRAGYVEVTTGGATHSLFPWAGALLFVESGTLTKLDPSSLIKEPIVAGLNPNRYVSFVQVGQSLYWSNGEQSGKLSKTFAPRAWSVPRPLAQPTLSMSSSGGLAAGQYQVAITHVDATGEESGTGVAATASGGGSLVLSAIPTPAAGCAVRIYMTPPNGDQFFEQTQLPVGVGGSYTIYAFNERGVPLETQFMQQTPAGQIIRFAFGRLWSARDNMLFFSSPLQPGLHRPMDNYLVFRERITVLEPLDDGIWVATQARTYWIAGTVPETMTLNTVSDFGAVEGTGTSLDASKFALKGVTGGIAYWFGDQGGMLGLPQAQLQPFMEKRVPVDKYERGATILREENGLQQVITAVRDKTTESRVRVSDVAEGTVRRNGIIIS